MTTLTRGNPMKKEIIRYAIAAAVLGLLLGTARGADAGPLLYIDDTANRLGLVYAPPAA